MAKLNRRILFCSFLFLLLLLPPCPTVSQEVENEREFSYSSDSETGPVHWGELHHEWRICGKGLMQSPIDLSDDRVEVVPHLGNLKRSYKPSNATLKNRGHDMMLRWVKGGGYLEIKRTKYQLQQAHWHSPSEHTINGKRFDLELHLVHQSSAGDIAVVGILYRIGPNPDLFLSSMKNDLIAVSEATKEERVVGVRDPRKLVRIRGRSRYYRYVGSLTVPPCTENVAWTILKQPKTVTYEQIQLLRVAVHDESDSNARPLKPDNKRKVEFFMPRPHPNK